MMNFVPFAASVTLSLGVLVAIGATLNVWAAWHWWRQANSRSWGVVWLAASLAYLWLSVLIYWGHPVDFPSTLKRSLDGLTTPASVTLAAYLGLAALFVFRRFFLRPEVALSLLNVALLTLIWSLADRTFASVVLMPDNVPVLGFVFLLGFFVWLGGRQAQANDDRHHERLPPVEGTHDEKVLVWPDLVYIELIAALLVTSLLIVWSLLIPAPLEAPANPSVTPNPSKAPWYFVGLQELLAYADAWWVGVMVPALIVVGLVAIPYIDRSPEGSGCYSIRNRRFAWVVFLGGFLLLWILPILIGAFMRGPNWSFFGPFEARTSYKITAEPHLPLSAVVWQGLLGRDPPRPPLDAGALHRAGGVLLRELTGIALMLAYLIGLPLLLSRHGLGWAYAKVGRWRYWLMTLLLLLMLTLPLKMFLQWAFGLGYIVGMPEYGLNF
jgi:hypothetical protein